uniref:Uncharacterized protein n=1 Tax=Tanacetum cinerariifolium TaxID=118510 RepID=A0A6L2J2D8_TANCI|nr:hypothetical protein [Tanacetum cinerariifolium]
MELVLSHDGDTGGNDQPPGPFRRPRRGGCQGSGGGKDGRGKTTLVAFRKMWEDNGKKLLPIDFDSYDGEMWKPVGTYSHLFITTISLKIGDEHKIPFYFDSWANVEDQLKIGTDGNPDEYPSLVSDFGLNHTSKATGTYVNEVAATKHKAMMKPEVLDEDEDEDENENEDEEINGDATVE